MKHLYIIGNGFDIHTGLATRYADFRGQRISPVGKLSFKRIA